MMEDMKTVPSFLVVPSCMQFFSVCETLVIVLTSHFDCFRRIISTSNTLNLRSQTLEPTNALKPSSYVHS